MEEKRKKRINYNCKRIEGAQDSIGEFFKSIHNGIGIDFQCESSCWELFLLLCAARS
jgi:hypothetical protein